MQYFFNKLLTNFCFIIKYKKRTVANTSPYAAKLTIVGTGILDCPSSAVLIPTGMPNL